MYGKTNIRCDYPQKKDRRVRSFHCSIAALADSQSILRPSANCSGWTSCLTNTVNTCPGKISADVSWFRSRIDPTTSLGSLCGTRDLAIDHRVSPGSTTTSVYAYTSVDLKAAVLVTIILPATATRPTARTINKQTAEIVIMRSWALLFNFIPPRNDCSVYCLP